MSDKKQSKSTLQRYLGETNVPVWRGRLSWKIASSVFLTILIVQLSVLLMGFNQYEQDRLSELRDMGRAILAPILMENKTDSFSKPITDAQASRVISSTRVNGFVVYTPSGGVLGTYGEPVSLIVGQDTDLNETYRSINGGTYEVIYKPHDLYKPYIIVAKMDSNSISSDMQNYVYQNAIVTILLSAFVSVVLMMALSRWLLEPLFFMRSELLRAKEHPEDPQLNDIPFDKRDEVGSTLMLAQDLILQNSQNINRIRSKAEDQIHQLAYYDTLTGLPNREMFLTMVNDQIVAAQQSKKSKKFAIIALDIDHFKDINDTVGHKVGDALLEAIGKRLRDDCGEEIIVARSGEDEFALTAPLEKKTSKPVDIAKKIEKIIKKSPFEVMGESFQVRASIGVATYPNQGNDVDNVLKNADIALNQAKESGRDQIREYSDDYDRIIQERFQTLKDLRVALEHDELTLHYQPQLDLKTGKVIGAEALLRWWKPDNSKEGGSFIPPTTFIPVAEQSGLIVPMGAWILREAARQAKEWHTQGLNLRVAVNVSPIQFMQGDLLRDITGMVDELKLPPHLLEVEVTESTFMEDKDKTINILNELNKRGIELAIDDFGTGYSSLSYLRLLPIDRIKVDQSFVKNSLHNTDDAAIAKTIITLGHSLGLKVIAEGVETKDHEDFLKNLECDEVQGYKYSKAVPPDDLVKYVTDNKKKVG